MARIACRVFGGVFVAIGLVVLGGGDEADLYHNLLHLVTGGVALAVGFVGSAGGARRFCQLFGGFYLVLGAFGLLLGDLAASRLWQAGPLSLDIGDHIFHIVLGLTCVASGLFTGRHAWLRRVAVRT
jgi:hypothetical protein